MNPKKIPRNLLLLLLTIGASLILGFLSFGGMFALWPILPLAFAAFGLSVAYEGEIYLQNIKGAFNKLFKRDYLKHQLANKYLHEHLCALSATPESPATPDAARVDGSSEEGASLIQPTTAPEENAKYSNAQFFIEYNKQADLLRDFGHKHLSKASRLRKKQIEKTMRDMEKWFASKLFSNKAPGSTGTPIEVELLAALNAEKREEYKALLTKRSRTFQGVKAFSALAGAFMSLGTTYLLVEAFSIIPFFAALPFAMLPMFIVPMALIAGAAYGFLTYNAVTDMISNDTLRKWFFKIGKDLREHPVRGSIMAVAAIILVGLAVALTICTAGTWWTIAQETRPLFTWMSRMPGFIMGIINPIITGLSAVVFNLQNSSETLELADNVARRISTPTVATAGLEHPTSPTLLERENRWQIGNPFRLLLKITVMPLRVLLFIGHLISIGVTADRVPGMSEVLSALLGIISEGFEDFHYFFGHDHKHGPVSKEAMLKERLEGGHGHNHDVDLPTRALKLIFSPIYLLAAIWDWVASLKNDGSRKILSFDQAWNKQMGIHEEEEVPVRADAERPSAAWQVEHTVYRIKRYQEKHTAYVGRSVAKAKDSELTTLAEEIQSLVAPSATAIAEKLTAVKTKAAINSHRFFGSGPTATRKLLDALPERTNLGLVT